MPPLVDSSPPRGGTRWMGTSGGPWDPSRGPPAALGRVVRAFLATAALHPPRAKGGSKESSRPGFQESSGLYTAHEPLVGHVPKSTRRIRDHVLQRRHRLACEDDQDCASGGDVDARVGNPTGGATLAAALTLRQLQAESMGKGCGDGPRERGRPPRSGSGEQVGRWRRIGRIRRWM